MVNEKPQPPVSMGALEARVKALESPKPGVWLPRWLLKTVLPAVVISVAAVLLEAELTATVELRASVQEETAEKLEQHRYHIAIQNIGKKAAVEGRGHMSVRFYGTIEKVFVREAFPSGVHEFDDVGKKRLLCDGRKSCRVHFGDLESGGIFNIRFAVWGPLLAKPYIQYGGKPPTEWSCEVPVLEGNC